jgi:hypothetical protein
VDKIDEQEPMVEKHQADIKKLLAQQSTQPTAGGKQAEAQAAGGSAPVAGPDDKTTKARKAYSLALGLLAMPCRPLAASAIPGEDRRVA